MQNSEGPLILRLAHMSAYSNSRNMAAERFAADIAAKTDGKVKVEILPVVAGMRMGNLAQGLKKGGVQVLLDSVSSLETYCSLAAIEEVPFIYRDNDHFKKIWSGQLGKQILDEIGSQGGFELMGPMLRGTRYVTSKKAIETADDLKGLKIRVPAAKLYIKTWEKLGANAMPFAFDVWDMFKKLQQGYVEAQENPLDISYSANFHQVCPYLIKTRHVYNFDVFIFDQTFLAGLPADVKTAIREAAEGAAQWRTAYESDKEEEYILKFKEKGVRVIEPDIKTFTDKLDGLLKDFPELQDHVARIQAVQ